VKICGVVSGHGYDGDSVQIRQASDLARRSQTVNKGQAKIHQDYLGPNVRSYFHSFLPIGRFDDVKAAHLQESSHHLPVVFGILNQQYRRITIFIVH
jgi:hypothetical protein